MPAPASSGCWYCASWISNLSLLAYCLWGSASSCLPHLSHSNTLCTAYITPNTTPQSDLGSLRVTVPSQTSADHQRCFTDTFMLFNNRMCTTIQFYTYSICACVSGYRNMYMYTRFQYIFGLATSANNTSCSKTFKMTSRHEMKNSPYICFLNAFKIFKICCPAKQCCNFSLVMYAGLLQ